MIGTYLLDGVEVKKTGRIAERKKRSMRRSGGEEAPVQILVEVVPVEDESLWTKWVDEALLFAIRNSDED